MSEAPTEQAAARRRPRVPRPLQAAIAACGVAGVIAAGSVTAAEPPATPQPGPTATASATPGASESAERVRPVTDTTIACPRVGGAKPNDARLTVGAVPEGVPGGGALPAGAVTGGPLGPVPDPDPVLGDARVVEISADNKATDPAPWALHVPGAAVPYVGAYLDQRPQTGPVVGYGTLRCPTPSAQAWFAGFASTVGQHATLVLTNVDDTPATLDVDVWGDSGPADTRGLHGIVVDPRSQQRIALETAAPDLEIAAAHVAVSSGRVAAAVVTSAQDGNTPLGFDWLPQTTAPARTSFVPGIAGGDGDRTLVLAAPGDTDATVSLKVITEDGSFVPEGMDAVNVPAGSATTVDLAPVLAGQPAAVQISSSVPVVATAKSSVGGGGTAEYAFAPAAAPVTGTAVVAGTNVDGGATTALVLTAPDAAATVVVSALNPPGGKPVSTRVAVPAGSTVAFDVAKLMSVGRPVLAVVPAAGSGMVYAGRAVAMTVAGNPAISGGPLVSVPGTRELPLVRHDQIAALP